MQIGVGKPNFTDDFKARIHRAIAKGCNIEIVNNDGQIFIYASVTGRSAGVFVFEKQDDTCNLIKKRITEREYCPFELGISRLVKNLKKTKIKFINWN